MAALGVVFGDIGTSPLYTIKTCFTTAQVAPTLENVLGISSLLLWALAFVVCVKYVGNLMRVDHDGEGGILALLALASPPKSFGMPLRVGWLTIVVVAGAAMLFGDGIITPAISVISAVEGVGVVTKSATPFIVPVSVGILVALFLIQSRGTEKVGRIFGPVMVLWFAAIGVSGAIAIARKPHVLYALDPRHALRFITHHGIFGFLIFAVPLVASFVLIDGTFFLSGLPKIPQGAWVPLVISAAFMVTALTWLEGRRCVAKALLGHQLPLDQYLREANPSKGEPQGTMVFLTGDQHGVPFLGGKHHWIRARADEERVVLLTLTRAARPYVPESERVRIQPVSERLSLIMASFGYMERPSIDPILKACGATGLQLDTDDTSFFYADPKLTRAREHPLPAWQRGFFAVLARNSRPLPDDLGIRPERRVELGIEIAI